MRAAEPVVVARRLAGAAPVGREEIRRSRVVPVVVRRGSVELVRARLQRQVHRTRTGVADLRIVGGGFDLELLDRVRGRLDAGARLRHDVARSVDRELAVDRPRDRHAAKVVVVHRTLQRVRPLERRAGDEPRQAVGRSVPERNFADELGVDHLPDGRAAGLELRALAHHEDRFGDTRGPERRVELDALADVHLDALIFTLLEAAQLDRDGVGAREQQHGGVLPRLVGRLHHCRVRPGVDDGDGDARQGAAG